MYIQASLKEISSSVFWKRLSFEEEYPEIEGNYLAERLVIDSRFKRVAGKLSPFTLWEY